jgi:transcriptional regulator with XRE-family HTH domain
MTTKNTSYFEKLEKQFGELTFGGMLKAWRESEDLNQTEFAKKIGFSVQNLNDLEKGRRIPTPNRAAKIAKKLSLPEVGLIQLALRDSLAKEGFKFDVKLESA